MPTTSEAVPRASLSPPLRPWNHDPTVVPRRTTAMRIVDRSMVLLCDHVGHGLEFDGEVPAIHRPIGGRWRELHELHLLNNDLCADLIVEILNDEDPARLGKLLHHLETGDRIAFVPDHLTGLVLLEVEAHQGQGEHSLPDGSRPTLDLPAIHDGTEAGVSHVPIQGESEGDVDLRSGDRREWDISHVRRMCGVVADIPGHRSGVVDDIDIDRSVEWDRGTRGEEPEVLRFLGVESDSTCLKVAGRHLVVLGGDRVRREDDLGFLSVRGPEGDVPVVVCRGEVPVDTEDESIADLGYGLEGHFAHHCPVRLARHGQVSVCRIGEPDGTPVRGLECLAEVDSVDAITDAVVRDLDTRKGDRGW